MKVSLTTLIKQHIVLVLITFFITSIFWGFMYDADVAWKAVAQCETKVIEARKGYDESIRQTIEANLEDKQEQLQLAEELLSLKQECGLL